MSACEEVLLPHTAMRVAPSMQSQNFAPNVITYSAAISACEKRQQLNSIVPNTLD